MHSGRFLAALLAPLVLCGAFAGRCCAQDKTYRLDEGGQWNVAKEPAPDSDEGQLAKARALIAQGKPKAAERLMDLWLEENDRSSNPWIGEAYLIRGDARLAQDREYRALEDYEEVAKRGRGSDAFVLALTREYEIGIRYLNGLKRRFLGMRIEDGTKIGEELLIRVQERLPGSRLAERALLDLADYYYRTRDLTSAATTYEIFLRNYPTSEFRQKAMLRRIYSNIARFKGPRYDGSGLVDSTVLIRDFASRYPADADTLGMNDALIARLDESAGAQMLETARWYLKRNDAVSSRLTVERLLRKHPQTVAAVRAQELAAVQGWTFSVPAAAPAPEAQQPGPGVSSGKPGAGKADGGETNAAKERKDKPKDASKDQPQDAPKEGGQ